MILVVGLGNPGDKYSLTRHNIGFLAIDHLLSEYKKHNTDFVHISKPSFEGEVYRASSSLFLKPHTFMNLSGNSVAKVAHFYKCDSVIIIHDDLDLPFGSIRFKIGGSDGGHNGLKSITTCWRQNYYRLRLGISRPNGSMEISKYVLSAFLKEELEYLQQETFPQSTQAFLKLLQGESWEKVASLYSHKGMR